MNASPERMAELYDLLEAGRATYEDVAELFANTMAGQYAIAHSGITRAEFIARLRETYPTQAALGMFMQQLIAMVPDEFKPKGRRAGPTSGGIH